MALIYTAENMSFTVDFDRFDGYRWSYIWTVRVDGATVATGADLRSGSTTADRPAGLAEMLASFFSFFSAYIEAGDDGECADLFGAELRPLAEVLDADTVAMWADEIKGSIGGEFD